MAFLTSGANDRDARTTVAAQALAVAAAWSPPDAPPSWWLTAELLTAIAEDDALLDLAAAVPPDRLPALLLSAAVRLRVDELAPRPLAGYFPGPDGYQPPRDSGFRPALHAFARADRAELTRLCAQHRYQMNEVGRCLDVLPALPARDPRPLALVDLGTGAGLGLQLDRYRYRYDLPGAAVRTAGDAGSPVALSCAVRAGSPPVPERLRVTHRVGIDVEPLDLADPATARWLAACVPPEAGAVARFAAAVDVARAYPAPTVRGDLLDVLPAVVADVPADALLCLVDTYVHVFLPPERRAAFDALVDTIGRERDLDWVSVDPLVPLGPDATTTVQGLDVPMEWIRDNRAGGVFGVVGRVRVRDGVRTAELLGRAHPGSAWLEWVGR